MICVILTFIILRIPASWPGNLRDRDRPESISASQLEVTLLVACHGLKKILIGVRSRDVHQSRGHHFVRVGKREMRTAAPNDRN